MRQSQPKGALGRASAAWVTNFAITAFPYDLGLLPFTRQRTNALVAACPDVPSVRVEVPNVGIAMLRSSDPTRPLGG